MSVVYGDVEVSEEAFKPENTRVILSGTAYHGLRSRLRKAELENKRLKTLVKLLNRITRRAK